MTADIPPPFVCIVSHVVDGDTWRCDRLKVRLARADAADTTRSLRCRTNPRAWCNDRKAAEGRVALSRMIGGRSIHCVPVPWRDGARTAWDRYGRLVVKCRVNGQDVGAAMIRAGLAREWR